MTYTNEQLSTIATKYAKEKDAFGKDFILNSLSAKDKKKVIELSSKPRFERHVNKDGSLAQGFDVIGTNGTKLAYIGKRELSHWDEIMQAVNEYRAKQ